MFVEFVQRSAVLKPSQLNRMSFVSKLDGQMEVFVAVGAERFMDAIDELIQASINLEKEFRFFSLPSEI